MSKEDFKGLNAEAQKAKLAELGFTEAEIDEASNAKGRIALFATKEAEAADGGDNGDGNGADAPAETTQPPKPSAPAKGKAKANVLEYLVAPRAPRIKHNGGEYFPGDVIEAPQGELDHLVKKGYVVDPAEIAEKGEYQAVDEAVRRQGYQIREGHKVVTPTDEGALDEDGNTKEIDKPKKKSNRKR